MNPWVITAFLGGLLAGFSSIAALSRLELSRAYPFTAASFVLILVLSAIFFDEAMTPFKVAGALLIALGLIVAAATRNGAGRRWELVWRVERRRGRRVESGQFSRPESGQVWSPGRGPWHA
jgi:drug/metabolite transporter (DMT)-like permease